MTKINHFIQKNTLILILTRSGLVGVVGTTIDFSIFILLHLFFGIPALVANSIAYGAGSINSFSMHRSWTYANRPKKSTGTQFVQFTLVGLGALIITNLILWAAPSLYASYFAPADGDIIAKVFATALGVIWNFLINYFWTFRRIY